MAESDIMGLLMRGGFRATAAHDSAEDEIVLEKYNGLDDPVGAERLGGLLADVGRSWVPDCVLVWEDIEDLALGFVVGRELGTPVKRVVNAEGLAAYEGELSAGTRALLVSDAFRDDSPLLAVQALLDKHGGKLVAALAVVDVGRDSKVTTRSLVSLADHRTAPHTS